TPTAACLPHTVLFCLPRPMRWFSRSFLPTVSHSLNKFFEPLDEVVTITRREALQHWLQDLDLQLFEFLHAALPLRGQFQDGHTAVSGVADACEKPLLHQAVYDLGDG